MYQDDIRVKNLDLGNLEAEYLTFDDEDRLDTNIYKFVIQNKLNVIERRIFVLYIESGRLKSVAEVLGCSTSRVFYIIKDIKTKILNEVERIKKTGRF